MRAKILLFFDICKYFLHIARNQHEIAEKERRKPAFDAELIDKGRKLEEMDTLDFALAIEDVGSA